MNCIDPIFSVLGQLYTFIDSIFFRIRTIVHCVANNIMQVRGGTSRIYDALGGTFILNVILQYESLS